MLMRFERIEELSRATGRAAYRQARAAHGCGARTRVLAAALELFLSPSLEDRRLPGKAFLVVVAVVRFRSVAGSGARDRDPVLVIAIPCS